MANNYTIAYGALLLLVQNISNYYLPYIDNIGMLWIIFLLTIMSFLVKYAFGRVIMLYNSDNTNDIIGIALKSIYQELEYVTYFMILFDINIITSKVILIDSNAYTEMKFYAFLISLIFITLFIANFVNAKK